MRCERDRKAQGLGVDPAINPAGCGGRESARAGKFVSRIICDNAKDRFSQVHRIARQIKRDWVRGILRNWSPINFFVPHADRPPRPPYSDGAHPTRNQAHEAVGHIHLLDRQPRRRAHREVSNMDVAYSERLDLERCRFEARSRERAARGPCRNGESRCEDACQQHSDNQRGCNPQTSAGKDRSASGSHSGEGALFSSPHPAISISRSRVESRTGHGSLYTRLRDGRELGTPSALLPTSEWN